jgi:3-hydroxyisobutyrate dehydrogenase-like beta-hydroxyacid dehydrogenase
LEKDNATVNIHDIAWIGVGKMGSAMVSRLLESGYRLTLFDSNRACLSPFATQGARLAASAASAVQGVQLVITMVPGDRELEHIALGDQGMLSALPVQAVHLSLSTITPQLTQRLSRLYASASRTFLGATVAGRPDRARAGLLSIFLAGPAWAKAQVQPVVAVLGRTIEDLGEEVTAAAGLKCAVNQLIGTHLLGMSYGAVTAQAYGVSPQQYFHLLVRSGLFAGVVIEQYGDLMAQGRFEEEALFPARLGLKDSQVIQQAEQAVGVSNPLMVHLEHLLHRAIEQGKGGADWSVIFQEVQQQAQQARSAHAPSQAPVAAS